MQLHPSIPQLAHQHYTACLEDDLQRRKALAGQVSLDQLATALDYETRLAEIQQRLAFADTESRAPVAARLLAGLGVDPNPSLLTQASLAVLRAELEAARRGIERNQANYFGTPQDPILLAVPPTVAAPVATVSTPLDMPPTPPSPLRPEKAGMDITEYVEDVISAKGLRPKTEEKYRVSAKLFEATMGRKQLWMYTATDLIEWIEYLEHTPVHHYAHFHSHDLKQVVAANQDLGDAAKPLLARRTIRDGHLVYIKQIFEFAANKLAFPRAEFESMRFAKIYGNDDSEREPFSRDQLNTLFGSALFTGSLSDTDPLSPGSYLDAGYIVWLPLIMYLGGARPSEVGQLRRKDLQWRAGWPCLQITGQVNSMPQRRTRQQDHAAADQKIKTPAAKRLIPLHPQLIRLGLLEHIGRATDRIFPDWGLGYDGTYSYTSSEVFNQLSTGLLDRLGVKTPWNCLYSLRHCFKDSLRRSRFAQDEQDLLMGHARARTGDYYGSRELFGSLIDSFLALDLGGVRLDHIPARYPLSERSRALLVEAEQRIGRSSRTNAAAIAAKETHHG